MRRTVRTNEVMNMYNRFLFIRADHLFEEHDKVLEWFAEYEEISLRLANAIIQIGRRKS